MLQHVVLFKLKPEYMEEIPQLVQGFLNMRGKVDGLVELHAGADILKSERSYDLGLVCVFRDGRPLTPIRTTRFISGAQKDA